MPLSTLVYIHLSISYTYIVYYYYYYDCDSELAISFYLCNYLDPVFIMYFVLSNVKHLTDKWKSFMYIWWKICSNHRKKLWWSLRVVTALRCGHGKNSHSVVNGFEMYIKSQTQLKVPIANVRHSLYGVRKCSQHWRNTCEAHRSQIRQPLYWFLDSEECNYNKHDVAKLHINDLDEYTTWELRRGTRGEYPRQQPFNSFFPVYIYFLKFSIMVTYEIGSKTLW